MRHGIPTTQPASEADPTRSRLTEADCLELALLALPDAQWDHYEHAHVNLGKIARGEATGDPRVDGFVEIIEARRKAAKAAGHG